MAEELRPVDVSDSPEILRLAQEVAETGVGRILRTDAGDLAVLKPVARTRKRAPRGRPMTNDDPFYKLIGTGNSGTRDSDASERKHEILARAYRPQGAGE